MQIVGAQQALFMHIAVLRCGIVVCAEVERGANWVDESLIGINQIAKGWCENGNPCPGGSGDHDKRQIVFGIRVLQVGCIDSAGNVVGWAPLEVKFPVGVFEIVVVKMDRPVLFRNHLVVAFVTGPIMAGYRPGWQVDCMAIKSVETRIADDVRVYVLREVPVGDIPRTLLLLNHGDCRMKGWRS